MTSTRDHAGSATEPQGTDPGELRVELRVRPRDGHRCALGTGARGSNDGRTVLAHDVVCTDGTCKMGCECRASVETGDGSRMVGGPISDDCICPVFRNHDCVASIDAIEHGELIVAITLPCRDVLSAVVEDLRDRGATVELRSIARSGMPSRNRQLTLDAGSITDKQREAIRIAFEEGYYESPRDADLGDLAERLGVSRSAVSQRLSAAESTLVAALYHLESGVEDR